MKCLALAVLTGCLSLPVGAADLVMVAREGCLYCAQWDREIAPIYAKTEQGDRAPLRRVDKHDLPDDVTFASRPVFTPTFVLVEDGQELGRIEGYAGDEFFWFILDELLDEHGIEAGSAP